MNGKSSQVGRLLGVALVGSLLMTGCATKRQHTDLDYRVLELEQQLSALENAQKNAKPVTTTVVKETTTEKYRSRLSTVPAGWNGGWMALPTGSESSSAVLVEKMIPSTVNAGGSMEYVLNVTNLTDNLILKDVTIVDTLDAGFQYSGSEPAASVAGGTASWTIASLAPGDSQKIVVNGTAGDVSGLEFCATVDYTPVLCVDTIVQKPGLEITKTGPDTTLICDPIEYTIVVSNPGTGVATNVQVVDALPTGLTTTDGSSTASFEVASLEPGQSREFNVTAKAGQTGTYANVATATSGEGLSVQSGTVSTRVTQPVLTINLSAPDKVFLGGKITYTTVVSNIGDAAAENVVVAQTLADCAGFEGASNEGRGSSSGVRWDLGTLQAGQSVNLTSTVSADSICTAESVAVVEGDCADPVKDAVQTAFLGIPAILLEVIDIDDPVRVGDETTYVITATNQGSAVGTNIKINATIENMTSLEVGGATSGTINGASVDFAPLATLAPKEKAEWRVRVRADQSGDTRFKVVMNSDQLTRTVEETEATNLYE